VDFATTAVNLNQKTEVADAGEDRREIEKCGREAYSA
jgi:hypothetical protein